MIIDGKAIASKIQEEITLELSGIKTRKPCLAMVLVGEHPPSKIYVNRKMQACEQVGMLSLRPHFPDTISEADLLKEIEKLNKDPKVDGILVQLPLPAHINPMNVIRKISPDKDVDGLHPINAGKLLLGDSSGFVPCTPLGIKVLLERTKINVSGQHVVIIGRSNLVGKPMAALLMQNAPGANASVTILHSHSKNSSEICREADILIVAIGKPHFVNEKMVKKGAVVIDVGINKLENKIVGDVDFEAVKNKASYITPVPGGVGPMTIAMLLSNTLKSYKQKNAF